MRAKSKAGRQPLGKTLSELREQLTGTNDQQNTLPFTY